MNAPSLPLSHAPRVLMSAYQCGPGMGSVSQIGWEWYSRMARRLPVTLLTHVRNRSALEAGGAPLLGSDVIYIDTEWFAGPLYRFATRLFPKSQHAVFMLSSLDFYVFDRSALRQVKGRLAVAPQSRWDLIHSPTPVSPVAASVLHRCGLPTVLGPLNGGLKSPTTFPEFMQQDASWLYPLRNAGRLMDWLSGATRHAKLILVATRATRDWYPVRFRAKCVAMLENAVNLELFTPKPWPGSPSADHPLHILFVGRLVPFKAIPLLLRAMQALQGRVATHLTIVGDGPMREAWAAEAGTLGLADAITFAGQQPLSAVNEFMERAHVFCLPSVRESGGAVLLEAMACARPVIAVDYGGPSEIVDDAVGRKVSASGSAEAIAGLVDALADLAVHPDAWRKRGEVGRARVEGRYSWEAKIDAALDLYRGMLGVS